MEEKIIKFRKRLDEINAELQDPSTMSQPTKIKSLTVEQAELERVLDVAKKRDELLSSVRESREIIEEGSDEELTELAQSDLDEKSSQLTEVEKDLKQLLLPRDPNDSKNIILEIRAGAGGDEAALFAANLFRMYSRYTERNNWKINILSSNQIGIGGYKEVIAEVRGEDVYRDMKYESGVHRVQRIPDTEKSGRIHTSTATVAILPETEDADMEIKQEDLRVDVFRSGGHGGQSVNTTDSAVRITHVPSGIVVTCQNERSQLKNKDSAMRVLNTRLLEMEDERRQKETGSSRKIQVGTGDRSEKIRTYNFPQDRITDHRIKYTTHGLEDLLSGHIDELIEVLRKEDQKAKMQIEEDGKN
ncbi:peptide chain release factor 1 [Patescibacteria group bacterium]